MVCLWVEMRKLSSVFFRGEGIDVHREAYELRDTEHMGGIES